MYHCMFVTVPLLDLHAQYSPLRSALLDAVTRVCDSQRFIGGPEVEGLERDLEAYLRTPHALGMSSGTDALVAALMALNIGPGDEVITPTYSFFATAGSVARLGAQPVLVDIDADTFNMNAEGLKAGVTEAKRAGLNPVAVIPVDLFGLPADYDTLLPLAEELDLWVLSDAAQSFGGVYKGRKVGTMGVATTTSFFPAKPLGCYGDGGAIFTDDSELAAVIRSLRVHGQGADKYDNVRIGINGRLDTIQAAVLIEKLKIFPDEIEARDRVARRYNDGLSDVAGVPRTPDGLTSTWAQYTLRLANRDAVAALLKDRGVPTAIYYPKPLHQQTAYRDFPVAGNGLPVSERLAGEVLSLPMHPYLEPDLQDRIIETVADTIRSA